MYTSVSHKKNIDFCFYIKKFEQYILFLKIILLYINILRAKNLET